MKVWSLGCREKEKDTKCFSGETGPKSLSFLDITTIGVGSSLGIGISVLIGGLIKNVTGPAVVISIFLAGITALIGGLCCAEFGIQFLKTDSVYSYSYFWGEENIAFILGWALILEYVAGTASAAKGIITFIDALSDCKISDFLKNTTSTSYFPDVFPNFDFLSSGIVVFITIIIAFEVKDSLFIKKLFTVCNIVLIASIIIGGICKADVRNWQTGIKEKPGREFVPFGVLSVIKGAAIALYGFIGFDTASISGEEIKKRKRNLPLSILVITLIVLVAYVGIGVVLTLTVPYDELNSFAALPFAFQQAGWISFKWIVAVGTFFGFQTSLFGVILPLPKLIRAMANDGLLFRCLGNCHSKFKTPILASLTGGIAASAVAAIFPFQKLVNLTVIGALFVYTVLAINLVLLRYSPKLENDEKLSNSLKNVIYKNKDVSMKAVIQNYFNFKKKYPTNLTKIIITGNLVLFCISSTGISIIFNIFYDYLVRSSFQAVIPASILLSVLFFNLISITCQPKSQEFKPFKVFLAPFIPCLSIFLNIFLMVTFESLTWILFSTWMAIGITIHLFWRFLKCLRGEINKNSLYDINKTNALKLNESIWKIKSDKKSFYEGAINPVFSNDLEDKYNQMIANTDGEVKKTNEKTSFQLKQAEIIQTAELVVVERTEPLENELELNFIRVSDSEMGNRFQEGEKVHWECIAEIHTEKEFAQESVALEIVDNTYNFLSEVSEDMLKDDISSGEIIETTSLKEKSADESKIAESDAYKVNNSVKNLTMPRSLSDFQLEQKDNNLIYLKNSEKQSFKEELLSKVELRMNNKNNKKIHSEEIQPISLMGNQVKITNGNSPEDTFSTDSAVSKSHSNQNQNQEQFINLIVETFYKPHTSEMILHQNKEAGVGTKAKAAESVLDEQNKIKEFKEKLNQLLKNQLNNNSTLTKNSFPTQSVDADNAEKNNNKNNEASDNSIKTLNKSQIKGKLELLLSKGPPKRPSFGSSFNLKIKELEKDSELEKTKDEILSVQNNNNNLNDNRNEGNFEKSSDTLPDSIKETILSFNDIEKLPNDVCC